jgi:hypothetical protein
MTDAGINTFCDLALISSETSDMIGREACEQCMHGQMYLYGGLWLARQWREANVSGENCDMGNERRVVQCYYRAAGRHLLIIIMRFINEYFLFIYINLAIRITFDSII